MTIQDTTHTIGRNVKHFFSGTLLSRLTGFAREIAMAAVFGITPSIAAFWMAFRFAHLLRRLFGEGGLHAAFVPHFEHLRKDDPIAGAQFFYHLCSALTCFLLTVIVLTEITLAACLIWADMSPSNREVVQLTMIMLPALIFITLYALNTSLLNCKTVYFLPSVAPAVLNIIWLGAIFFVAKFPPMQAVQYLAMIIVFAFAFQWVTTMPPVFSYLREALRNPFSKKFDAKELLKIVRPFSLGLLGIAATQLNSAIDTIFARIADAEGPAYLWYAMRIQQLPLALIGVALTGALLPPLSRAIQNGDKSNYFQFLNFSIKKAILFMIPSTLGIVVLGFSAINLIYGHGHFSQTATCQTTLCLWSYGTALLPMTLVMIAAAAFYSDKNYLTPTWISISVVFLNTIFNSLFIFVLHWGAVSIALSTSLGAWINALLLLHFLKQKEGSFFSGLRETVLKTLLISLLAAGLTFALGLFCFDDPTAAILMGESIASFNRSFSFQLLSFTMQSCTCIGIFFILFYFFKMSLIQKHFQILK